VSYNIFPIFKDLIFENQEAP